MIKNKKLFVISLFCLLISGICTLPFVLSKNMLGGWFYIAISPIALVIFTLVFLSLKKTKLIKEGYALSILICIANIAIGIFTVLGYFPV